MRVEVWSDIVCPWCFIGKRRLERALEQFPDRDSVEVVYRSFELDPDAPSRTEGTLAQRLASKYDVTVERAEEMQSHVSELAAAEGLTYRFDLAQPANSFDAHRLLHLAAEHGRQAELKERLMLAYFSEGKLISDPETLGELAAETGVPRGAVQAMFEKAWFEGAVRRDEQEARHFGISGVPTFIVDRQIGVTGAQPSEVLLQLLQEGREREARAGSDAS